MKTADLTGQVIELCIKIHSKIGPGCFEKVYEDLLYYELCKLNLDVRRQVVLPISYEELYIEKAYKIDLLVEKRLILELKSVFPLAPVYFNQLQTQLSLINLKNGMLINFKVPLIKEGIHRVYNNSGAEFLKNLYPSFPPSLL